MAGVSADSNEQPRVLVTGASGFIGSALATALAPAFRVRTADRRPSGAMGDSVPIGDMSEKTDWRRALEDVAAVVHLAGPAHGRFSPDELRGAIVGGAESLAAQAAQAGVKRFVFVSSIHACAKRTDGAPLTEQTPPAPTDAYGAAKLAAEHVVLSRGELKPIVLRPPLIHGARARGNFARLLRLVDTPWPLPLGGLRNRRSVMSLDSLDAAIITVLRAPTTAPGGVFHLCDGPAVSTSEMAASLRHGLGRPVRLFAAPALAAFATPALTESLEIDAAKFRAAFGYAGVDSCDALVASGREWAALR